MQFLVKELKCLIHNPSKDVVLKHLPEKFNNGKYESVRHIIGQITNITTHFSRCLFNALWLLQFCILGLGGKASDAAITRDSGFYNILEYRDEVMADKGFTIAEELLIRHWRLHIPPGKRGSEQMRKGDVKKKQRLLQT